MSLMSSLKRLVVGESVRTEKSSKSDPACSSAQDNGHDAWQLNKRGLAQMENKQFPEATESFIRAIALQHDFVDAHRNLGKAYMAQGEFQDALDCFYLATHYAPGMATAYLDLGVGLVALTQTHDALVALRRAVELDPGLGDAYLHLAKTLESDGELEQAVACYRRAMELLPDSPEAHCNFGYALFKLDRFEEAETHYRIALGGRKDFAEAQHNLGLLLLVRGEPDRALLHLETAYALKPGLPETLSCLGHALRDLGRYDEALARYDEALAIRPGFGDAVINRAQIRLALGNLRDGWQEYEQRFDAIDAARRNFSYPTWSGEDLADKTILIWAEQGVGDHILFAGLLPDLIARSRKCIYECAGKLVPLLTRSFPQALIVPRTDPPHPSTQQEIDCQIAAGSVARWLRLKPESFPRRSGYLVAARDRVEYWRRELDKLGPGLKVGFSWRSSIINSVRALHCTRLDQWGELLKVPGVRWVCLQYDQCEHELETARRDFGVELHHFRQVDYFDDLDEVAALMQALDLVVSAPTAVSMQAAALGVEVWQMGYGLSWLAHGTEGTPWFPTLKRYDRRWDQQWSEVLATIAHHLRERSRP